MRPLFGGHRVCKLLTAHWRAGPMGSDASCCLYTYPRAYVRARVRASVCVRARLRMRVCYVRA